MGVVMPALLGFPLLLYALCGLYAPGILENPVSRVVVAVGAAGYLFGALLFICCVAITVFYALRAKRQERAAPDVVIVLGAGLRDGRPSRILRCRLRAAMDAALRYGVAILVTGGKGKRESITEAESMRRYLIAEGFPKDKILYKEQARNTLENLKFSEEVLRPLFPEGCRVLIATSDFHCFRSAQLAKKLFQEVSMLPVPSAWYMWLNFYLRETLSMINYYWLEFFHSIIR